MSENRKDWLDRVLARDERPEPADAAFLARLKTIPANHPRGAGARAGGAASGWGQVWADLAPLFRPARTAAQGGLLTAALVAGLVLGGRTGGDPSDEPIDLTDYVFIDDWSESLL